MFVKSVRENQKAQACIVESWIGNGCRQGQRAEGEVVLSVDVQHRSGGWWGGRSLKGEKLRENDGRVRKRCFKAANDLARFVFLEGEWPCKPHLLPLVASAEASATGVAARL